MPAATDSSPAPSPAPAEPRPQPPTEADCCHSDCAPHCVFDVYERDLLRWQEACERQRQLGNISCR